MTVRSVRTPHVGGGARDRGACRPRYAILQQAMEVTPTQLIVLLREGTAPLKARAAIARGTLPLPPATLLEALDILADDPDPGIQNEALSSFERLPRSVVRGVASSPAADAMLLDRLARRYRAHEPVLLDIARNGAAADATVAFLASLSFTTVLEVIGRNQARLERSPETVAALLANPATPTAIVQNWQEHVERRTAAAAPSAPEGEIEVESGGDEPVFAAVLVEDSDENAALVRPLAEEAGEVLSAKQLSIYALLKKMSMGQKVALAVKGNREVRNILIRENNRMLCLKVLENPRIADSDIEAYAKSTNLSDDVLRGIANQKEWVKKYTIVRALVFNPKAPLGVTLDLVKRLTLKDIEFLSKNRNVPETLRSAGRRLLALKRQANH